MYDHWSVSVLTEGSSMADLGVRCLSISLFFLFCSHRNTAIDLFSIGAKVNTILFVIVFISHSISFSKYEDFFF